MRTGLGEVNPTLALNGSTFSPTIRNLHYIIVNPCITSPVCAGESSASCHGSPFPNQTFSKSLQTMGSYHHFSRRSIAKEFTLSVCDVVGANMDAFINPSRDGLETIIFEMA